MTISRLVGLFLLKLSVTEKGQNLLRRKFTNMLFLLACINCRQTRLNDDAHTYTIQQTDQRTSPDQQKYGRQTRTRHRKYHTITVEASVRPAGQRIDQTYVGLLDNLTQGLNAVSRQHCGYLALTPHTTLHCTRHCAHNAAVLTMI